ncbi:type II secretion system GspH family protein [Marinomonas sp. C2222]|uniref:Type II secretion system GspH family protein n=1 Tax=Marinomonas sargassi TaxID=2984494 RepID=A0ABT2YTQ5_9GAMM|nr:type II secretion system protein [Marinomonas sargassi]MCV2403275.1 type II secretion system GspH family protein [Marinomonas sargassi]
MILRGGQTVRQRGNQRGSLLLEMMVACLLISIILPTLVVALSSFQERQALAQRYQDHQNRRAAINAHFHAQWSRLIPAHCFEDSSLTLTIQSGHNLPSRLSNRSVKSHSDWLLGSDYGACRTSLTVNSNPFTTSMDCYWKAGDEVTFSSCGVSVKGQLLSVSSSGTSIELENDTALGHSGIVESEDAFYWYLREGKDGSTAFWRTPAFSGNSLELMNGIERLALFPLLDTSNDGFVDSLSTHYRDFALQQVRGIWVEYLYRLTDCQEGQGAFSRQESITQEYTSMRGEVWLYKSQCQAVANQIIKLRSVY